MYDSLDRRQSNAGAFKLIRLVQALKHPKQFIYILHIKPRSVVPDEYDQVIFVSLEVSDLNLGREARAREFNRIGNKIHQYKP
jgi:hypothetical protein